jgi:murein DD-endopeptidase MepM/ murein hydrolase activator NlpD
MPVIVKSAWPGLTRRRALFLQGILAAVLVTAWFRGDDRTGQASVVAARPNTSAETAKPASSMTVAAANAAPTRAALASSPANQASLSTIEVIVGRNDTLDRIFRRLELDVADLASMRALPELRSELDRLRPGELLKVVHSGGELFGLERQLSDSETLKVTRDDAGFDAEVLESPLDVRVTSAQGVIRSSLFQATSDAGVGDHLALEIAQIFAYDIDFVLEIRPGDRFVVTYEQIWKDGRRLKDGNILAVKFFNQGREYRAVRFERNGSESADYYTPDGRSLRKAFLRAPLQFSRVSSRFNPTRRHPVLNRIRAHKGVDYAAPTGTPVRAAGDGRVRFVGRQGGYGNVIELEHSGGVVTVYGHLSRFAIHMRRGNRVGQGQLIGYVGRTGLATGPHLHYEYRVRGVHKDPQTVPLPKADPVPATMLADFHAQTAALNASLDVPVGPLLVAR